MSVNSKLFYAHVAKFEKYNLNSWTFLIKSSLMKFIPVSFVGVAILCQFSIIWVKSRNGEARICKYMLLRGERKKMNASETT